MSVLTHRGYIPILLVAIVALLLVGARPASAAPFTENGITTEVFLSASTAEPGATVAIDVEGNAHPAKRGRFAVEVVAPDNTVVFSELHPIVVLNPGRVAGVTSEWDVPSDAQPGDYTVTVRFYHFLTNELLHSNLDAATITVGEGGPVDPPSSPFEVWTTVQGTNDIHVLAPVNGDGSNMELVATIDYEEITGPGGDWEGYTLRNPHMVLFGLHGNPGGKYAYVSNVSSANTSVIDASAREVVAVLPTGTRTHAVQPSPDGSRALAVAIGVANIDGCRENFNAQCGQVAEIITDTENGVFTLGRTYNFSDFPEDSGWEGLPRFDPVCGSFTPDSRFFYVTNTSGGLIIFEINEDPSEPLFDVVRIFPAGTGPGEVARDGCGIGYSTDGRLMFANSATPTQSFYYTFNIRTHRMVRSVDISEEFTDIHGMMLSPRGDEVVMVGRLSDNFLVLNQRSGTIKRRRNFELDFPGTFVSSWTRQQSRILESSTQTIALTSDDQSSSFYCAFNVPGEGGSGFQPVSFQQTVDPAPDLVDFSPDGKYIYVTLRGPNPATGTHAISGYPPGVVVIDFETGETVQVIELPGDQAAQDPHGIAVRRNIP